MTPEERPPGECSPYPRLDDLTVLYAADKQHRQECTTCPDARLCCLGTRLVVALQTATEVGSDIPAPLSDSA